MDDRLTGLHPSPTSGRRACSVAGAIAEHVTFEVECIDQMYLNMDLPTLQHAAGVAWFYHGHRSPVGLVGVDGSDQQDLRSGLHQFCRDHDMPMVRFRSRPRQGAVRVWSGKSPHEFSVRADYCQPLSSGKQNQRACRGQTPGPKPGVVVPAYGPDSSGACRRQRPRRSVLGR